MSDQKFYEQRVVFYRLLSALFYLPEQETDGILNNLSDWSAGFSDDFSEKAKKLEAEFQKIELQDLQVEYSKLFVGPFDIFAPPYASLYIDKKGHVMTETSLLVDKYYEEAELKVDVKEPPDHIALELEYLHVMASKGVDIDSLKKQKEFYDKHLMLWLDEFCENIKKSKMGDFYKILADMLNVFCKMDYDFLVEKTGD